MRDAIPDNLSTIPVKVWSTFKPRTLCATTVFQDHSMLFGCTAAAMEDWGMHETTTSLKRPEWISCNATSCTTILFAAPSQRRVLSENHSVCFTWFS